MREITITAREADQRLDRFLQRLLPEAGKGFLYRMLRKKNITLNGRKADGSERLQCEDRLQLYFSEETLQKFSGSGHDTNPEAEKPAGGKACSLSPDQIVCESEDVLILDKPAGILSQKAEGGDISMVEMVRSYLTARGELTEESGRLYMPGVVNRLDRNTSGLIIAAKTLPAARELSACLKDRTLRKYYYALVRGTVEHAEEAEAWLGKGDAGNQVTVSRQPIPGCAHVRTAWKPLAFGDGCTLLEVHLITGRTHQIRAHLSFIGHPLAGDVKYGIDDWNRELRRIAGLRRPFLHACRLQFPDDMRYLTDFSGKTVEAPLPEDLRRVLRNLHVITDF